MFMMKSTHNAHMKAHYDIEEGLVAKYMELLQKHDALIDRINDLGGEQFLKDAENGVQSTANQLTQEDIKALISLCHPDKHGDSEKAKEITQKLLGLRE